LEEEDGMAVEWTLESELEEEEDRGRPGTDGSGQQGVVPFV